MINPSYVCWRNLSTYGKMKMDSKQCFRVESYYNIEQDDFFTKQTMA